MNRAQTEELDWLQKATGKASGLVLNLARVALLVIVLVVVADVALRYLFAAPILGSLDIVTLLLLVVIFSGVAYTAHLKRHVAVDVVVSRLKPRIRAVIDSITGIIAAILLGLMIWQGLIEADILRVQTAVTAQLRIPLFPFDLFLTLGLVLLLLVVLADLKGCIKQAVKGNHLGGWIALLSGVSLSLLLVIAVVFRLLPLAVTPLATGAIGLGILVVFLFSGMPVGYALALVGFVGTSYVIGLKPGLATLGIIPFEAAKNYSYLAIPLFVLMGELCYAVGLSQDAYYAVHRWLGRLPGGLAMATIAGCAGFAAVSGTTAATAATMGTVALPEMKKYNYDDALATGTIATGGTLGIMIPPSITFIIYALVTEQSIGRLFIAGIIPGIILASMLMLYIYIRVRVAPHLGPPGPKANLKEKMMALRGAWAILVLFIVVIGGIYGGIFTPYEAGAIGAAGALLIGLFTKHLTWRAFNTALTNTVITTSLMLLMLIGAAIVSPFLAVSRLPMIVASSIAELELAPVVILMIILFSYTVLGCLMPNIPLLLLTIPLFFPIIVSLGYDPIWFGVIVVLLGEIAIITPPVGLNIYIVKGVAPDVPLSTIFRGVLPFILILAVGMVILVAFPQLSTFLPTLMKG